MKLLTISTLFVVFSVLGFKIIIAQEITNVVFSVEDQKIKVFYDLIGETNYKYNVNAQFRSKNDSIGTFPVNSYEGQLGSNVTSGYNNSFEWNFTNDIDFIPNTTDYEFVFTIQPVLVDNNVPLNSNIPKEENKTQGGSTWYYYVAGAVVVVVALVFTVFKPVDNQQPTDAIPNPPARP